jgi:hypothetical protein
MLLAKLTSRWSHAPGGRHRSGQSVRPGRATDPAMGGGCSLLARRLHDTGNLTSPSGRRRIPRDPVSRAYRVTFFGRSSLPWWSAAHVNL